MTPTLTVPSAARPLVGPPVTATMSAVTIMPATTQVLSTDFISFHFEMGQLCSLRLVPILTQLCEHVRCDAQESLPPRYDARIDPYVNPSSPSVASASR